MMQGGNTKETSPFAIAPARPLEPEHLLNEVWVLPIDTEINAATTAFVRSRINRANEEQPLALVLPLSA